MADNTPGGAIVSFGGTSIPSLPHVNSIGFPSVTKVPVEAYESTLGLHQVVDLLNNTVAPQKQTITMQVLIRADDTSVTPWPDVTAGYRALESLPETGTLVVNADATGGAAVSCQARRKPIDLTLTPSNARHILVSLQFIVTSDWA